MRIALISPGFSAHDQDWCIPVLLHLVRRLARVHEVTIITLRYPFQAGRYRVAGADVYALGGADAVGLQRGPLLARALHRIVQIGRAKRIDVLHAFWADEPGFLAVAAGRLLGLPSVVSLMGGELVAFPELGYGGRLSRLNRLLSGLALHYATNVSVGSRFLEQIAMPLLAGRRLHRLTLGVEPDVFMPQGSQIELGPGPHMLAVGGLVPIKAQATLIHALALLQGDGTQATLHLLGRGPQQGALEQLARQLGLERRVVFHGAVAHHRLPEYYRAADLCLLGSYYESQSLAVVEAAACSRVTVGSAVGIMPELGIALPPGDPVALATRVAGLLAQPEQMRALGRQRRVLVKQHYTLEQTVQRLEQLYRTTEPLTVG